MAQASWTWMIYLATHNDAAPAGEESLARMRQAELGERVRVVVQQSTPSYSVRRILGHPPEVTVDLGQIDSGAPKSLLDFVRWAVQAAPAYRYALVLWSHGSGWEPKEMERLARQQPAAVPVTEAELTERGAEEGREVFFSTAMRRLLAQSTPVERAIAFDDGSGHSLDTIELGQVAAEAVRTLGRPLDLIGMNACQMGNVEVAYQLRDKACVYVASEEDMPVESWPYKAILSQLVAQPETEAGALGKQIVERYCDYFRTHPLDWGKWGLPEGVTLTAVRLGGIDPLAQAVQALATTLQADMANLLQAVWAAHRRAHKFKFRLYDLASFCRALSEQGTATPAIVEAARTVLVALEAPAFLLARDHTSPLYDDIGGLTTYLMPPSPGRSISPYYVETDYAQATRWGEFLKAYHAVVT